MSEIKTNTTTELVSTEDISVLRVAFKANELAMSVLAEKGTSILKAITYAWLDNDKFDAQIANAICTMHGPLLQQTAISRLSYKLPSFGDLGAHNKFKLEEAKLILAKTILDGLADLKVFHSNTEITRDVSNGATTFHYTTTYRFGEALVKDLTKGVHYEPGQLISKAVHTKPGSKVMKLTGEQKDFLKELSSLKMRLVRTSEEVLKAYYEQSEWYVNALSNGIEDRILLNERVGSYIRAIQELQALDTVHLSNWYDSRLRMYYELTLAGINPHGDTFETAQWELSEAQVINEHGYNSLVHAAVTLGSGKRHNNAMSDKLWVKYEAEFREAMLDQTKHDFGELFYNVRLLRAIDDYRSSTPSRFMLGKDATTGGLQHFGAAFKSVKSRKSCNIGGLKTPQDAHKNMGDSFGIERKKAKKINTPLLHGSTMRTVADIISNETNSYVTEGDVIAHITDVYGDEIMNVPTIAQWGSQAYDSHNTSLLFTALDGWKCQSTAYSESVPVKTFAISLSAKVGYSYTIINRDMPLFLSNNGEVIYENSKIRGLYANITHSLDGWILRHVGRALTNLNKVVLFKHDKFFTHPNDMKFATKVYLDGLTKEHEADGYKRAMLEVSTNRTGSKIPLPKLDYGTATLESLKESQNFLMA